MKELKELIENNINIFRPGYILTDKEFKMSVDINEIKQLLSELEAEKKDLTHKIWQLKGTLEKAQENTLEYLVGLAFWNDEDDRGFIVVSTPQYKMNKFRGSFLDPYNIPVLYFDKKDMSLNIVELYSKAVESEDPVYAFIKEQKSIYRQIPAKEFTNKVSELLREYITKLMYSEED
jgi:hypothetical protein